jgi:hypothetical protein
MKAMRKTIRKSLMIPGLFAVVLYALVGSFTQAAALSPAQSQLFNEGIYYYNTQAEECTENGNNQAKTFDREPITATWNISDNTVEQWFLKQPTARATIIKYGLTSSNIGDITSVVRAAGVSPVFFYLYTVNEGGGLGGFINHYSDDIAGGGVANAKRDAEYLATYAEKTDNDPAWIDVDNYVDFVPQDVKDAGNADFKSMPLGTIGRVYIPATAAATWEVYYPNGLKKEFNKVQDYGPPLEGAMQNIKRIGGNPLQAGATLSAAGCAVGVTGEGMTKAINFAVAVANNNGYGYDQPGRETGWQKWQSDPSCTNQCGSFDCSSLISAALTLAGYFEANPNFATSNEASALTGAGFKKIADSATTSEGLLPGDILLADGHTEMYIGNNQLVGAHINENGGISGGEVGDQTGKEISVGPFYNHPWIGVFRAQN